MGEATGAPVLAVLGGASPRRRPAGHCPRREPVAPVVPFPSPLRARARSTSAGPTALPVAHPLPAGLESGGWAVPGNVAAPISLLAFPL